VKILITNDDGINSPCLPVLKEAIHQKGWEATIVAPKTEQSGVGHSITIFNNITIEEVFHEKDSFGYALHGTPADCVKFAVNELYSTYPDAVISGINRGFNVGTNVLYSGTVSAAIEASLLNIPALAVSTAPDFANVDLKELSNLTLSLLQWRLENNVPPPVTFNVNIPALERKYLKGIQFTRQGKLFYKDHYKILEKDKSKTTFVNAGTAIHDPENHLETDSFALNAGYISITPLQFDLTAYAFLKEMPPTPPSITH